MVTKDINEFFNMLSVKTRNLRYELGYSDFDDISITSSNGDKITADADNLMFKLSYLQRKLIKY